MDNPQAELTEAEAAFVETMGLIVQGEGLPRIAGRILGLFIADDRAYSFAEIAMRLEVSRGSVSADTRMLEEFGLIERIAVAGDRKEYFRLAADPYSRLVQRQRERLRRAKQSIESAVEALADGRPDTRARIAQLLAFYETQLAVSEAALEQLTQT